MNKKFVNSVLACAMTVSTFSIGTVKAEESILRAGNENLALNQRVTASDSENGNPAANAVDGNKETRWATNQNVGNGANITIDFDTEKDVNQIDVYFERGYDDGQNKQNIHGIKVEVKAENATEFKVVKEINSLVQKHECIVLDKVEKAKQVRITATNVDEGGKNWINVGINEIEVYSKVKENADETVNKNHMLEATVSADSMEVAEFDATKVKDGRADTRWASNYKGQASANSDLKDDVWLKADFDSLKKVEEIQVDLFTRNVDPKPTNVKAFDIYYTDADNQEHLLKKYDNSKNNTNISIVLENTIEARGIKLCNFVADNCAYNNISINEMRVFSNKQAALPENPTLDQVVANVKGGIVDKDTFELPTVPNGFTIEFNGADFEQIIGKVDENGKIAVHHPLTDKDVKVSFNVKETKTGKVKNTGDKVFTVKGTHLENENKNKKPVVIPEIQEWYSSKEGTISKDKLTKVVYSDDSLKPIVEEFVSDYNDFTGIKLVAEKGNAQNGAINFAIDSTDKMLGEEGYTMDINENNIVVKASSVTGNMYGMQTILQMYKEDQTGYKLGKMRDYPRFETRGLLLDVARKPVSLEMMKEITRTMRYYKMNDFQAHLSDNYIWLEDYGTYENENEAFKAYEAFRLESGLKNDKGETPTAKDYFISKKDFQKFIHDERALGMKVVPEIDVPAHATSFTKVWPELAIKNQVRNSHPLIDHFDLTKRNSIEKIKEIFNDYTKGNNPTFDKDTTIHIGADEFLYNYKSYRDFINEIVPYIKQTNTVRMWGGLTMIKDNPETQINQNAIENVEMNLWNSSWANGKEMYDLGFKLINTIDDYGYMVPNGNLGRANAYGDLLNVNRIFESFEPNKVGVHGGYVSLPSGDDQVLGAAYAIWSDNIDKRASGLTESDLYWRFFDALPFYAEKTWAATGKEKGTAKDLSDLANKKGTGPNTNPYYQEDKKGKDYAKYDFENNLEDSSENNRDLVNGEDAKVENGALKLGDKVSYVTSPIEQLGNGNALSFDIKLDHPSKPGDILFEEDAPYGTHDIRVMDNGKLGFTRELYDYYFEYELPVGKQVNIQIVATQQKTQLYVDGEYVCDATGRFYHENMVKKSGISNATFALPLERIGSKTNSLEATIDNVVVTTAPEQKPAEDLYNKAAWQGTTNSQTVHDANEGELVKAFDNNSVTRWHSNWQGAQDKVESINGTAGSKKEIFAEITFDKAYRINEFSFTPRTDSASGYVTRASLYVKNPGSDEWKLISKDQKFENNGKKKTFYFDLQNVSAVKFVATQSNDGWVAVSEFDIKTPTLPNVIYVEATKGGKVEGGKEALSGEKATVKAIADQGYDFDGWYNSLNEKVSADPEYTFTVLDNTALLAKFVRNGDLTVEEAAKQELQDLVDQATTDFEGYTEESVNAYKEALNEANAVLNNENATLDEINDAIKGLKEAVLVKEDTEEPSKPSNPDENNPSNPEETNPEQPDNHQKPSVPTKPEKPAKPTEEVVEDKNPNTGVSMNMTFLWTVLLGAGATVVSMIDKTRKAQK